MMSIEQSIAKELSIKSTQVSATIALLDEGNTIPFIARYRKERTGSLDETQIRQIQEAVQKWRALEERRATILKSIAEQEALTDALAEKINAAQSLTELEDLYQPYKPKRRTRATIARERGLAPLADLIIQTPRRGDAPTQAAQAFINDDVPDIESALAGARDIVAEIISNDADVRGAVREKAQRFGQIAANKSKDADDPTGRYETYYDFELKVGHVKPHQVLALNRGEAEGVLKIGLAIEERDWLRPIEDIFRPNRQSSFYEHFQEAASDGAKRLLLPAIERDIRRSLTEQAETQAIRVFADNLQGLLKQPPLSHTIMGVDPAYRTGCKIAVIDVTGKVLATDTVYPTPPQKRTAEAKESLNKLIKQHNVTLIAIGNGTASRETEQFIANLIQDMENIHYIITNEAGASVYSASPLAKQELPDLDVSLRGAVSIARRVLDPLAELVKIDPQSIGIGMYQHDVNQNALGSMLDHVVETVVNQIGVDVNTASPALLRYVSGIGPKLADNIVHYRETSGVFQDRKTLRDVPQLGPKAFEQSAGFLRIRNGINPLDSSAIHPESYAIAEQIITEAQIDMSAPAATRETQLGSIREDILGYAEQLGVGVPTLVDIIEQLIRPGRDPREDVPPPILRSDVLKMEDLEVGMLLSGTVRNVVDFGAFVDIGVKQDGLLHRSQIPRGTHLQVGDIVEVTVLSVDLERKRIGLSLYTEL